jgi:hypothetical protein
VVSHPATFHDAMYSLSTCGAPIFQAMQVALEVTANGGADKEKKKLSVLQFS